MSTVLWAHQQEALQFIQTKPAALLNMDMGTGKSAVAVRYLEARDLRRVLILCPKSVAQVWPRQFELHGTGPWTVEVLDNGPLKKREQRLKERLAHHNGEPLAVVLNYDVLPHSIKDTLKRTAWDALVMDECHKLKSPSGVISRTCSQLADRIPNRLGLTGTVMPHSPLDVYAQFRALNKRIFGTSFVAFKSRFAVMGGFQAKQVVSYQNTDDLHRRMMVITYRCKASDVLTLPPFVDVDRHCDLPDEAASVYADMEALMIAQIETGEITASNALVKLLRLSQIANGFVTADNDLTVPVHTAKRELLADVLEELVPDWDAPREPVVVFGRFRKDLDAIFETAANAGYTVGELSGRCNDLDRWYNHECNLLAVQLQSGGVGIDLTRARYCIYYSHDWSLGNYDQSRARVHRPGQTRPVTYVHLLTRGTVDERVCAALQSKRDVVDAVLEGLKSDGAREAVHRTEGQDRRGRSLFEVPA
jgi:SNF2 family DNA or RNA helicase